MARVHSTVGASVPGMCIARGVEGAASQLIRRVWVLQKGLSGRETERVTFISLQV